MGLCSARIPLHRTPAPGRYPANGIPGICSRQRPTMRWGIRLAVQSGSDRRNRVTLQRGGEGLSASSLAGWESRPTKVSPGFVRTYVIRKYLLHQGRTTLRYCWRMTLAMEMSIEAISAKRAYKEILLLWVGLVTHLIHCVEWSPLRDNSPLHYLFHSPTISLTGERRRRA